MTRLIIGVAIASVVLFFWGFLVWGLGPYKTTILKPVKDDDLSARIMRDLFPENGVYLFPNTTGDPEKMDEMAKRGPVAMVHMIAVAGRPAMDPMTMIKGFALNVVALALIAILLRTAAGSLPTYFDRVKFVALVGFTVALLVDGGDIVWWGLDWRWKLYQAFYDVTFWLIAGLVLGVFVVPSADARRATATTPVAAAKT